MKGSWKDRLYAAYVSSGQAGASHTDATKHFSPRQAYVRMVIRKHIPPDRAIRILDLGCGHGAYLFFLQQAGYETVLGVDNSAEQVELAHALGISSVGHQDIGLFLNTVEDEKTDAVLLMDVLEHLPRPDMFELLDEVFRTLRPGGKCIIHVPNAAGIFGMHVRYGDLTHETAFTPRSAQQLLLTVGFHNILCFEDQPIVHGAVSALRWLLWQCGTLPVRLLLAAETGGTSSILSQNMLVTALKPQHRLSSGRVP